MRGSGGGPLGLVGVIFVAFLGLGWGFVVRAACELVGAVDAGGLHGGVGAREQVGEAPERGEGTEGPEGPTLAEQLRQRDGRRERAGRRSSRRGPAFQIRLL